MKLQHAIHFISGDEESDKSAMQHREQFVEMNIDAIVDANATIDIDDVNRVDGVDEYHQL